MKGNIIGFHTVKYINKDGIPVEGINLCLTYEDSEVFGRNVKEIFISASKPLFLQFQPYLSGDVTSLIGAPCEFDYAVDNRNGKTFARLVAFKLFPIVKDDKKG